MKHILINTCVIEVMYKVPSKFVKGLKKIVCI